MDTQSEEIEKLWRVAEALDQEVDFLEQELERAEALLKLPPEKEGSFDSQNGRTMILGCPIKMI